MNSKRSSINTENIPEGVSGELTIGYVVVVVVDPSLHHSGPGLSILSCAPLVWHRGGLELHNHLQQQEKNTPSSAGAIIIIIISLISDPLHLRVVHDNSLPSGELQSTVPLVGRNSFLVLCLKENPPE